MTVPDAILVRDLRVRCIIGTAPKERDVLQEVVIQLELHADLGPATRSDDIEDTADYKRLKNRLLQEVGASRFRLLEALAGFILDICLDDARVRAATVTVDKPGALTGAGSVAVRMSRAR